MATTLGRRAPANWSIVSPPRSAEPLRHESVTAASWNTERFAGGAITLGVLILAAFAVPVGIIAAALGQASALWVAVPHLALASLLFGGILSAMFLMDAPDDAPAIARRSRHARANRRPPFPERLDAPRISERPAA